VGGASKEKVSNKRACYLDSRFHKSTEGRKLKTGLGQAPIMEEKTVLPLVISR